MKGKLHAPRTGIGYSSGTKPPAISKGGSASHPKRSDGDAKPGIVNPSSKPVQAKAADHAMLRKPY